MKCWNLSMDQADQHSPRPRSNGNANCELHAVTYLSPGIPLAFFEQICDHLARTLDCSITLHSEPRLSGPMHGDLDPFAEGRADIGFLCSPSYLYLREQLEPSVELVPAGFVFADERSQGQPIYFSEVVVRADHPARQFTDLLGSSWGYNDECSLSGYFATLQKLSELGSKPEFFRRQTRTGSHHASIEMILSGAIDVATIDSVALRLLLHERPELRQQLHVLDSFGPFPIQPVVVRSTLGANWATRIGTALMNLDHRHVQEQLSPAFGLLCCAPIDEAVYADEHRALCRLGQIKIKPLPQLNSPS
ncbi:MAG: phosphonate transport system substrate-binding protein [Planctomycetota bacterium]|jgi:phosphonate transport system substrate-binding protein